jgi:quercetin dioxygenase-like cupin family protein
MDRAIFESELVRDGYRVVFGGMDPNQANPEHSHEFDARAMVLAGEITITRDGEPTTFRPGDSCTVPAGTPHAEQAGPQGVAYVAGYRTPG